MLHNLSDYMTLHFQDRRGAASLRYTDRAKIRGPFICVNKSPYGFRAAQELCGIVLISALNFLFLVVNKNP